MSRAGRRGRFVLASDRPVLIQHSPPRALRAPGEEKPREGLGGRWGESPAESAAGLVPSARRSRACPPRPAKEAAGGPRPGPARTRLG